MPQAKNGPQKVHTSEKTIVLYLSISFFSLWHGCVSVRYRTLPDVSLIVADFITSVSGSSCNSHFFGFLLIPFLFLSIWRHPQGSMGCQARTKRARLRPKKRLKPYTEMVKSATIRLASDVLVSCSDVHFKGCHTYSTLVCLVILCEQKCVIKIQQHFFTSAHSQGTRHQPNTSIVKQAKKADGNAHLDQKETKK